MSNKKTPRKKSDAEIANLVKEDIGQFEYFFITRWKEIVAVMAVILIAVGVYFTVQSVSQRNARVAATALSAAATEAELRDALGRYGTSPAAVHARLRLIRLLANENRFEDAASEFRILRSGEVAPDQLDRVRLEEAYMQEKAEKFAEAAELFAGIGRNPAGSAAARAEGYYAAGRLYAKLGQKAEATECLQKCTELVPELNNTSTQWSYMAQSLLVRLEGEQK